MGTCLPRETRHERLAFPTSRLNWLKKATQADDTCQPMELGQNDSCSDSASEHQGHRTFGCHRPGEGPVPPGVDTVVLLSGKQVYQGTPEQPILVYEKCKAEKNVQNQKLAIWRSE